MIYKTLHRKLKSEQREPHLKKEVLRKGEQFLLNYWYPLFTKVFM